MTAATVQLAAVDQYAATSVTTAGFALGLALLGVEHWRWYKTGGGGAAAAAGGGSSRDPKDLIPFWFGVSFGILMVACPAGFLGTAADFLRWGGNSAGGVLMSWMTGQDATTVASNSAPALDGYGATVVTALVLALWWQRKAVAKVAKGKWKKGVLSGVLLCISTGTAAIVARTVVGGTNDLGKFLFDTVTTGALA
ncbi:hypothetical protein [Streptomyces longispororuber]|uniref:hypothetical protein n=1 Tax=Streptomyces longispororuber TaxID=68230 RepID=UPI0036FB8D9A